MIAMAQKFFRIPLVNQPQIFNISLGGRDYRVVSRWNGQMNAWQLCLSDAITRQPLLTCLPLVTGGDLLEQFHHLGIPGKLFCYTEGDRDAPPTLENLGVQGLVYYVLEVDE